MAQKESNIQEHWFLVGMIANGIPYLDSDVLNQLGNRIRLRIRFLGSAPVL